MIVTRLIVAAAMAFQLSALERDLPPVSAATDYAHFRLGINPPKLLHSKNPEYTPQALEAQIEGAVALQAVVDVNGYVAYASVLSPMPAGLDAKALEAVKHWRYTPAIMDGEKIPILITIEVQFRLPYKPPDAINEQRQNAVRRLVRLTAPSPGDVKELKTLSEEGVIPAVGLLGAWEMEGKGMPLNSADGLAQRLRAANGNDPASLLFWGNAELTGKLVPKNEAHGWQFIQRAAFFGNAAAQNELAEKNLRENNLHEAQRYFRMCAATAHSGCEYQLGKLFVTGPGANPNDFTQGVAWLELAKEHGSVEAAKLWQVSIAKITDIQIDWVAQLKPHLELKKYRGFNF